MSTNAQIRQQQTVEDTSHVHSKYDKKYFVTAQQIIGKHFERTSTSHTIHVKSRVYVCVCVELNNILDSTTVKGEKTLEFLFQSFAKKLFYFLVCPKNPECNEIKMKSFNRTSESIDFDSPSDAWSVLKCDSTEKGRRRLS